MTDYPYGAKIGNRKLKVWYDENCESPREYDNLGTMLCLNRHYNLGDSHNFSDAHDLLSYIVEDNELIDDEEIQELLKPTHAQYDDFEEGAYDLYDLTAEELEAVVFSSDKLVVLPLYLYDHSGIAMNTTGFSCPWDSGQVGVIFATRKKLIEETGYTEDELFNTDKNREPKIGNHVKVKLPDGKVSDWGKVTGKDGDLLAVNLDYNKIPEAQKDVNLLMVTLDDIAEVMADWAKQILINEVTEYDQWLHGDCYYFEYYVDDELEESCGGIIGIEGIEWIADSVPQELVDALEHDYDVDADDDEEN